MLFRSRVSSGEAARTDLDSSRVGISFRMDLSARVSQREGLCVMALMGMVTFFSFKMGNKPGGSITQAFGAKKNVRRK